MPEVIIGMDPHKHSATIEIINGREQVLDQGRYATTTAGYRAMLAAGRAHPQRRWAVEGCNGVGRHIAQRLVADGETVVDVPSKLSAQVRVFATGQGRKTDPIDAHSVAVAALRTAGLRQVTPDDATVALRLLVDRRDQLGRARTDVVNRLHVFLLDLIPGGAKKDLSARQARALLSTVEPTDLVGRTRHQLASELVEELDTIDAKIKAANRQLTAMVKTSGSRVQTLHGIGPSCAARLIGDLGDITRFASRGHFAAWNGTAPLDASSGTQRRHRLSRAGNRRINQALHIMAVVQLRHDTEGRRYFDRRLTEGKTSMEAMRALKRRLSDVVYHQMLTDAKTGRTGPGGQPGATLTSSAANPNPTAGTSESHIPDPPPTTIEQTPQQDLDTEGSQIRMSRSSWSAHRRIWRTRRRGAAGGVRRAGAGTRPGSANGVLGPGGGSSHRPACLIHLSWTTHSTALQLILRCGWCFDEVAG